MSRGAAFALFVDDGAEARALLRQNVEALGLAAVTRIFRRDATKLGPAHPVEPFSLVFLDPPYGKGLAEQALVSAREGGWLTNDALIVVEEAVGAFKTPPEFEEIERRAYDDTEFAFFGMRALDPTQPIQDRLSRRQMDRRLTPGDGRMTRHFRPNSRSISPSFSST